MYSHHDVVRHILRLKSRATQAERERDAALEEVARLKDEVQVLKDALRMATETAVCPSCYGLKFGDW